MSMTLSFLILEASAICIVSTLSKHSLPYLPLILQVPFLARVFTEGKHRLVHVHCFQILLPALKRQ